jgi:hypothetical protein
MVLKNIQEGDAFSGIHRVLRKHPKNCSLKRAKFNVNVMQQIDLRKRSSTLKDLANELPMGKTKFWRRLMEGKPRRHTNAIKYSLAK